MTTDEAINLIEDLVYCCSEVEDMSDCIQAIAVIRKELELS
jgi:hypothetical protein